MERGEHGPVVTRLKAAATRLREKLRRLAHRAAVRMEGPRRAFQPVSALVKRVWWKAAALVGFAAAFVGIALSPPVAPPPVMPQFQTVMRMPQATDQLPGGIRVLNRFSWIVRQAIMTIQNYITTVQVAMAVSPLSVAVQVGAVAFLTIPAIGFVTARLRRRDGNPILACEPPGQTGEPPGPHPRYILEQGQQYLLTIGLQRPVPES